MATDVSASLPDLVLAPGSTLTVTMDDTSAVITLLNVYGFSPPRDDTEPPKPVPPLFAYGPGPR